MCGGVGCCQGAGAAKAPLLPAVAFPKNFPKTPQVLQWGAKSGGPCTGCGAEGGLPCGTQDTSVPHQLILHPNPSGSGWQVAMQLFLGHHWALWPWLSRGCLESPGHCNWHRAAWGLLSCVARSWAWWEEAASAANPCARLPSRPLPWPCCWQDIWARAAGDAAPAAHCAGLA